MSEVELKAHQEVALRAFSLHVQIESRVLAEMVYNQIVPAAIRYQNLLLENLKGLKEVYGAPYQYIAKGSLKLLEQVGAHLSEIKELTDAMIHAQEHARSLSSIDAKAQAYCTEVKPFFDTIRIQSDNLEKLIADDLWPFTKYRELLFTAWRHKVWERKYGLALHSRKNKFPKVFRNRNRCIVYDNIFGVDGVDVVYIDNVRFMSSVELVPRQLL